MSDLTITRDDVLEAIEREHLRANQWMTNDAKGCRVCAVGAVLRAKLDLANPSYDQIRMLNHTAGNITKMQCLDSDSLIDALKDNNYMGALSIQFERLAVKMADRLSEETNDIIVPTDLTSEQLEGLKPALKQWVLETMPDGVIYGG